MQQTWDDIWKNFKGLNWFGRRFKREEELELNKIFDFLNIPKSARTIDIGCGTGFVLNLLRKKGYKNSIGIDNSQNALFLCQKLFNLVKDKDVFLMDCKRLDFPNKHFDLVFSEGLLEHFKNATAIAKQMCRVSKKWVLIVQPNSSSLFGKTKNLLSKFFKLSWQKEYSYTKRDYIDMFKKSDFTLENYGQINFNEIIWLLFRR